MKQVLIVLMIFTANLFADMKFANILNIKYDTKKWSSNYCKKYANKDELCMSYEIIYPTNIKSNNDKISKLFKAIIGKNLNKYSTNDAKAFIKENGDSDSISGSWDDTQILKLFSSTKNSFTISTSAQGYTGGAHGYGYTSLANYDINSGNKIELSDLISSNKEDMKRVVEMYYRQKNGIMPREDLTKYDWFDNKFVLAENFAITNKGIYFIYNSYEIKSFADGQTKLFVPYKYLKDVLKSSGVLAPYLHNTNKSQIIKKTFDSSMAQIKTYTKVLGSGLVSVELEMKNLSRHKRGWLSISFPQLRYEDSILKSKGVGFDAVSTYPKGRKIYNILRRRAIKASYLLVEGESRYWEYGDVKGISLIVDTHGLERLYVNLRGSFKDKNRPVVGFPNNGIEGQQGFYNYSLGIDI